MRAAIILFLLLGLVTATLAADDDTIYDLVRKRLYEDPDVKGANLTIEVHNGAVTLRGRVTSERIKAKAEKITRKVNGVKKVVNELEVGPDKPA